MSVVGIESINAYTGAAFLEVSKLATHRGLDVSRFENLLVKQKSLPLPYEDPITFGVNAAKPLIDELSDEEKNRIELLITCTESSFDFGKSMSTYFHKHLGLNRNCRLFELKNACYSGVAGLQTAANFILSQSSPGAKALVIASDISRFLVESGGEALTEDWSFFEPTGGAGAVAMLVSDKPRIFQIDVGASGYYGYEVMDTCRPRPDSEAGDADLSLLSYLDCFEKAYLEYEKRVSDVNFIDTFDYLAFHTPFGGMVKGAHRNAMRKLMKASPEQIERDFERRVLPGLSYCSRVGNIMGATAVFSLFSTIGNGRFEKPTRIGCFSYGSGCCSEFFSGVVTPEGQEELRKRNFEAQLNDRYEVSMEEYEDLLKGGSVVKFGTRNVCLDLDFMKDVRAKKKDEIFLLTEIKEFHREYEWVA